MKNIAYYFSLLQKNNILKNLVIQQLRKNLSRIYIHFFFIFLTILHSIQGVLKNDQINVNVQTTLFTHMYGSLSILTFEGVGNIDYQRYCITNFYSKII